VKGLPKSTARLFATGENIAKVPLAVLSLKVERTVAGSLLEGLLCHVLGRDVCFTIREIIYSNLDELSQPDGGGEKFAVREND
jgi:hypothetical protein